MNHCFSFYHLSIDPKITFFYFVIFDHFLTVNLKETFFKKHKKNEKSVPASANLIRKTLFARVLFGPSEIFVKLPRAQSVPINSSRGQASNFGRTDGRRTHVVDWGSHGRNRRFAQLLFILLFPLVCTMGNWREVHYYFY